jgi:hypothetical protein
VKLDRNNELGIDLVLTVDIGQRHRAINSSNLPFEQRWKSFLDTVVSWGKVKDAIEEARRRISRISISNSLHLGHFLRIICRSSERY